MKKKATPPPAEPKEKAVFLRMKPEDLGLIAELKKEFNASTSNQAVIKGLHEWKRLKNENMELYGDLRRLSSERDKLEADLQAASTAFSVFYNVMQKYIKK